MVHRVPERTRCGQKKKKKRERGIKRKIVLCGEVSNAREQKVNLQAGKKKVGALIIHVHAYTYVYT